MRKFVPVIAAVSLLAAPAMVEAKGCIRGAAAGAVAGHYAGHHAVIGAVGGCVAAHEYYKHKTMQQQKAMQQQQATNAALAHH